MVEKEHKESVESKWKKEFWGNSFLLHPREMQRFEMEVAKRNPSISENPLSPAKMAKKSEKLSPAVNELISKYHIRLSDADTMEMLSVIVGFAIGKEIREACLSEEITQYINNRVEVILDLLQGKAIKAGNHLIQKSEALRKVMLDYFECEMEEYAFSQGEKGTDVYCTILQIKLFGYDANHVRWLLNEMKEVNSNTANKESALRAYEMRRLALVMHHGGKVEKNGKTMKYLPKNEVLFIADLMIAAGLLKNENDSDDDKYSKYKRFLEVKELAEEAGETGN